MIVYRNINSDQFIKKAKKYVYMKDIKLAYVYKKNNLKAYNLFTVNIKIKNNK